MRRPSSSRREVCHFLLDGVGGGGGVVDIIVTSTDV